MAAKPTGMFYASAVQGGMQSLNLMMGGETAETTAAYNAQYQAEANRYAAQDALSTARQNMSRVKQNRILSHTQLQMQQDQAEAAAKIAAAHAGVEGSSADAVIQQTRANEQWAFSRADAQAEGQIEQLAATTHAAAMKLNSIQDQSVSYGGNLLLDVAGSVNNVDLYNLGTYAEENDWFADDDTMDYGDGAGMSFGERQA